SGRAPGRRRDRPSTALLQRDPCPHRPSPSGSGPGPEVPTQRGDPFRHPRDAMTVVPGALHGVAIVGDGDLGATVDVLDLYVDLLDTAGVAAHVGDRLLHYPIHRWGDGRGDHGLVDLDLERHPGAGSLVEQVAQ